MLNWLKERQGRSRIAKQLYGSIVTQARQPVFYTACGIPDTAQGRFEIIVLHVALMMRRLQGEGRAGQALARTLGETFVTDMDDTMREMTFSDLAVPREVKKIAAALYDRHAALADTSTLASVLDQQLQYLAVGGASTIDTRVLTAYLDRVIAALAAVPLASLLESRLPWPAPPTAAGAP